MDWKLLPSFLLDGELTESSLISCIRKLSENFTTNRGQIGDYRSSKAMVSAYSMFYLPTNVPKLRFCLDQLSREVADDFCNLDFIDIGTGPGTFLLAFLDYFPAARGRLFGFDCSPLMLEQAKILLKAYFPDKVDSITLTSSLSDINPGEKSLLFLGHSLNELGVDKAMNMVARYSPEYIFFIEPGTKEVFFQVMAFRHRLHQCNYKAIFPCSGTGEYCPIESECGDDWCHQSIKMAHEPFIERICQLADKDRRTMPMIAHIYRSEGTFVPAKSKCVVLIQVIRETKFSFEWKCCHASESNGENELINFEILKKNHSNAEIKTLRKISTGTHFNYEIIKKLTATNWRIRLDKTSCLFS